MTTKRVLQLCGLAALTVFVSPLFAPQLLAFPYEARIGEHHVYSEQPIDKAVARSVQQADALVARSPLPTRADQPIFLTTAGWRWRWLTQSGAAGGFAYSRPIVENMVINRSDPQRDRVFRAADVGGERALSGVIAHEITHGAIRRHFGLLADKIYAQELREGFCDFVAGETSLTDGQAAALARINPRHPALPYWRGRKAVAAQLIRNGGDVDALFANFPHQR